MHFKSHDSYQQTLWEMFKAFAFGFETCIRTISPLIIAWSALLVADHVSIRFRCCFSSLTSLTGFWQTWLHVSACYFQSVTPGSGTLVWISCSHGWNLMVHITVMSSLSCCSNSCRQTSVKLLATFAFKRITRAQEHWAAATQDSGLHTRHAASQ